MQLITVLAFLSIIRAVVASCDHDNCLRAVIASAYPTRNGLADCASYLQFTVTPATVTATATDTIITTTTTTTSYGPDNLDRRVRVKARAPNLSIEVRQATVSPTSIPAYASACSGAAKYSSACLCAGAIPVTITKATPTFATTTITTRIITTTSIAPDTIGNYQYIGCYKGPTVLIYIGFYPVYSNEDCQMDCAGYMYFGTRNGNCYCDNFIQTSATLVADSNCNTPCPDGNEDCGGYVDGSEYVSVWELVV